MAAVVQVVLAIPVVGADILNIVSITGSGILGGGVNPGGRSSPRVITGIGLEVAVPTVLVVVADVTVLVVVAVFWLGVVVVVARIFNTVLFSNVRVCLIRGFAGLFSWLGLLLVTVFSRTLLKVPAYGLIRTF